MGCAKVVVLLANSEAESLGAVTGDSHLKHNLGVLWIKSRLARLSGGLDHLLALLFCDRIVTEATVDAVGANAAEMVVNAWLLFEVVAEQARLALDTRSILLKLANAPIGFALGSFNSLHLHRRCVPHLWRKIIRVVSERADFFVTGSFEVVDAWFPWDEFSGLLFSVLLCWWRSRHFRSLLGEESRLSFLFLHHLFVLLLQILLQLLIGDLDMLQQQC